MKASERPLADQRRALIRERLQAKGGVRTADLAGELDVSQVTVRRDLVALEGLGEAIVVHGGARSIRGHVPPADRQERADLEVDAKAGIAVTAVSFLSEGDTIFVDSGTTCAAMIPRLMRFERLHVVTTDLSTATTLAVAAPHLDVIVAPGRVDPSTASVQGELVTEFLSAFVFDVAFISATTWHRERGATTGSLTYAGPKRTAIGRSDRNILLVDSTKYGVAEAYVVSPLDQFAAVVTDGGMAANHRQDLTNAGVKLKIARAL